MAKDGEYSQRVLDSVEEKEPRCIYNAPEASVIYGGAVTHMLTRHLLQYDTIAINRDSAWIKKRVARMSVQFNEPMFVTMDGKRFDST